MDRDRKGLILKVSNLYFFRGDKTLHLDDVPMSIKKEMVRVLKEWAEEMQCSYRLLWNLIDSGGYEFIVSEDSEDEDSVLYDLEPTWMLELRLKQIKEAQGWTIAQRIDHTKNYKAIRGFIIGLKRELKDFESE